MIDIWKYKDAETIRIIDTNGQKYEGNIIDITDSEEKSDLEDAEDSITILLNNAHIEFYKSEIESIDIVR